MLRIALIDMIATATMNAQKLMSNDVPANFTESLFKKYSKAPDIEWEKYGTDYKAEFGIGRMEYEVWLNKDGGNADGTAGNYKILNSSRTYRHTC